MAIADVALHVHGRPAEAPAGLVPLRALPWTWERILPLVLFQVGVLLWFGALWTIGCAISSSSQAPAEPWFDFERTAPFVPWLVPLYLSQNLAVALAFIAFRNVRDYLPVVVVGLVLSAIAATCFALLPMRLGFEGGSRVWAPLGAMLGLPDPGAGGYAPSLHVTFMVMIAGVASQRWGSRAAPWLWAWAVAVSASTYFVHEHHIIDIVTGAALGAFGLWLLPRVASRMSRAPALPAATCWAGLAGVAGLSATLLSAACSAPTGVVAPDEIQRSAIRRVGPSQAPAIEPAATPQPNAPARSVDAETASATLFACWELVRDNHFDPTFNGVDWEAVYAEFSPRAADVRTRSDLRHLLNEMLSRLGQSHFGVMPPPDDGGSTSDEMEGESAGVTGLSVRVVEGAAIVTAVAPGSTAAEAGIEPGWEVKEIDGVALAIDEDEEVPEHLRTLAAERVVEHRLGAAPGDSTKIAFADAGGAQRVIDLASEPDRSAKVQLGALPSITVELEHRRLEPADWSALGIAPTPDGTTPAVGYIRFSAWFPSIAQAFDEAVDDLRSCDAIVIDLRGNPGGVGLMAAGFAGHFFTEPTSLGDMIARTGTIHFLAQPRTVASGGRAVTPFGGPLAILLDSQTGSTSEVFAGGMVDVGRAAAFGGPSAGAALPAALTTLPSGDAFIYAIADYRVPSGHSIEGRGVRPNITPSPSRSDYRSSPDPTLRQALAWVASGGALPATPASPAATTGTAP